MKSHAVDAVAEEIAREKAEAFGRTAAALERSLDALRRFDGAAAAADGETAADRRAALVADAAERMLHLLVQREACGLRDTRDVIDFYGVPTEVMRRLGARA